MFHSFIHSFNSFYNSRKQIFSNHLSPGFHFNEVTMQFQYFHLQLTEEGEVTLSREQSLLPDIMEKIMMTTWVK